MRAINEIIIHCTATKEGEDYTAADIRQWHKAQGYDDIGYHYVIRIDGSVEVGRNIETIGAHCRGCNANSIGIVYVGGIDHNGEPKDTRTEAQRQSLRKVISHLKVVYSITKISGHNEYSNKACPCFNVSLEDF